MKHANHFVVASNSRENLLKCCKRCSFFGIHIKMAKIIILNKRHSIHYSKFHLHCTRNLGHSHHIIYSRASDFMAFIFLGFSFFRFIIFSHTFPNSISKDLILVFIIFTQFSTISHVSYHLSLVESDCSDRRLGSNEFRMRQLNPRLFATFQFNSYQDLVLEIRFRLN